jgi:biopolymer transport protein ExbD
MDTNDSSHHYGNTTDMAEISQTNGGASKGKIRARKQSIKIDMTPMVDLAFLLLTFFILTTTFIRPSIISLDMPDNTGPQSPLNAKNAFNLVLAKGNTIYWWDGIDGKVETTNYSKTGLRQILLSHVRANPNLMVLIKPKDDSKYENMVDVLDEISITNAKRYAIVDFTDDDKGKIEGR